MKIYLWPQLMQQGQMTLWKGGHSSQMFLKTIAQKVASFIPPGNTQNLLYIHFALSSHS